MKNNVLKILLVFLFIVVSNSIFILNEKEQAIITQFGKPIGNSIVTAGLKWKLPLVHTVIKFDKRFYLVVGNEITLIEVIKKKIVGHYSGLGSFDLKFIKNISSKSENFYLILDDLQNGKVPIQHFTGWGEKSIKFLSFKLMRKVYIYQKYFTHKKMIFAIFRDL